MAVKRHHGHRNFYEGKHLIGIVIQLPSLVHHCHGGEHSGTQEDKVLEKQARVPLLDLPRAGRE